MKQEEEGNYLTSAEMMIDENWTELMTEAEVESMTKDGGWR